MAEIVPKDKAIQEDNRVMFCVTVVHLLFAPSYVSDWTDVNVELGDGLVNVFNHGFGEYPVKADVQVTSYVAFKVTGV